jgi:hypothetical protein
VDKGQVFENRTGPSVLLDESGRVVRIRPGENDIRHIAPGVYFIQRNAVDGRRQTRS